MKITVSLAALAVLSSLPAAAQTSGAEAAFDKAASVSFSKVAAQAGVAPKPRSCEPAKELERSFTLYVPGAGAMTMTYAGCSESGRNDYLSGYTQRSYKGRDSYGMTLVTEHGDGAYGRADDTRRSQLLVSKGKDWVADFGTLANAALLSGARLEKAGYAVMTPNPRLAACEAALPKPVYHDNELWLLTTKKAYYYREDCDICAELDSCDLATGKVRSELDAHMVESSDLQKFRKADTVVWDRWAK